MSDGNSGITTSTGDGTPDAAGTSPEREYAVVVNDEEQYSVWPLDQQLPAGWRAEGTTGTRDACLDHIGEVWTDMRPLSARR